MFVEDLLAVLHNKTIVMLFGQTVLMSFDELLSWVCKLHLKFWLLVLQTDMWDCVPHFDWHIWFARIEHKPQPKHCLRQNSCLHPSSVRAKREGRICATLVKYPSTLQKRTNSRYSNWHFYFMIYYNALLLCFTYQFSSGINEVLKILKCTDLPCWCWLKRTLTWEIVARLLPTAQRDWSTLPTHPQPRVTFAMCTRGLVGFLCSLTYPGLCSASMCSWLDYVCSIQKKLCCQSLEIGTNSPADRWTKHPGWHNFFFHLIYTVK